MSVTGFGFGGQWAEIPTWLYRRDSLVEPTISTAEPR
jgi:hypothetical protein